MVVAIVAVKFQSVLLNKKKYLNQILSHMPIISIAEKKMSELSGNSSIYDQSSPSKL